MIINDPIADMLTRIRNANQMRYREVIMPISKMKYDIAKILKEEGFIQSYKIDKKQKIEKLIIILKYSQKKERVISGLKKISKPGLRVYAKVEELPTVLNGLGIAIISTSNGLMTNKKAKKEGLGGEVLAYIW